MTTATLLGPVSDYVAGAATKVAIGQRTLVVVRLGEDFYVLDDRCSHEDFPLSEGEVNVERREIECERHGAQFDLVTGLPVSFPATQKVATYRVTVVNGQVEVELP